MLTTVRPDGSLVSRAMYTNDKPPQGTLWFITNNESYKMDELEQENNVNVAYVNHSTGEWVSISGKAKIVTDKSTIREFYNSNVKVCNWILDLMVEKGQVSMLKYLAPITTTGLVG